jgi:hypothetical protein
MLIKVLVLSDVQMHVFFFVKLLMKDDLFGK